MAPQGVSCCLDGVVHVGGYRPPACLQPVLLHILLLLQEVRLVVPPGHAAALLALVAYFRPQAAGWLALRRMCIGGQSTSLLALITVQPMYQLDSLLCNKIP
jgi:hypothetical protein